MDDRVLAGLLEVVVISMVPVTVIAVLIHRERLLEVSVSLGRRAHVLPAAPAPLAGPPLEKLAADLRRLRPEARSPRPGVPMARQKGIVAAYDGVLVATARALGVPTSLELLPDGIDREAERLRVENALEASGLSWQLHQD
jgi:hypothetical protein